MSSRVATAPDDDLVKLLGNWTLPPVLLWFIPMTLVLQMHNGIRKLKQPTLKDYFRPGGLFKGEVSYHSLTCHIPEHSPVDDPWLCFWLCYCCISGTAGKPWLFWGLQPGELLTAKSPPFFFYIEYIKSALWFPVWPSRKIEQSQVWLRNPRGIYSENIGVMGNINNLSDVKHYIIVSVGKTGIRMWHHLTALPTHKANG